MKWIIISKDAPANLHALLESARTFAPKLKPDVFLDISDSSEMQDAYALVAARFGVRWTVQTVDFRQLADLVQSPAPNGKQERLLMLCTDTMLFRNETNPLDVWAAIQDPNVLGVSQTLARHESGGGFVASRFSGQEPSVWKWLWTNAEGEWGEPFHYGCVYRTSDILGPMCRTNWDSPTTLKEALCRDETIRRRSKMCCPTKVCLEHLPPPDPDATNRYLRGEIIDIARSTKSQYAWTLY